jgi:hypothetical protein
VSFWGVECPILGRTSEAREDVCEDAEEVCSLRMVVWCAIQELEIVSRSV